MREKQRKADLKKQGIVEEVEAPKKVYDDSFLKQFEALDVPEDEEQKQEEEEEKKQEEEAKVPEEVIKPKGK